MTTESSTDVVIDQNNGPWSEMWIGIAILATSSLFVIGFFIIGIGAIISGIGVSLTNLGNWIKDPHERVLAKYQKKSKLKPELRISNPM